MKFQICAIVSVMAATISQGQVVLQDTTGLPIIGNQLVGMADNDGYINQPANAFVVSGGDYMLESLSLELVSTTLVDGPADNYEIRLWTNDVNKPGTLLESIEIPNSSNLTGITTVFSVLSPILSNGTTYWVSAALPDDQGEGWWSMVQGTSLGSAIALSGSESAQWFPVPVNFTLYSLKVTGTPVPEPATLALLALGSLMTLRRR